VGVDTALEVAEVELAATGVVVAAWMLFVNTAAIDGETHGNLTCGAARDGTAREFT
jgi:hypothetical protein